MSHSNLPIAQLSESELRLALAEARMEITVLRAQLIQLRAQLRSSRPPQLTTSDILELDPAERPTVAPPAVAPSGKVYGRSDG